MKTIIPVVITFSVLLLIPLGYQSATAGLPNNLGGTFGPFICPPVNGFPVPVWQEGGAYLIGNDVRFSEFGECQEKHFFGEGRDQFLPISAGVYPVDERITNIGDEDIHDWHEEIVPGFPARWVGEVIVSQCAGPPLSTAFYTVERDEQAIWIDFHPPIGEGECLEVNKQLEVLTDFDFIPVWEYPTTRELDWGDLLDADGPTLMASGGPNHLLSGLSIGGPIVDAEVDGKPSAGATLDDTTDTDDEDGLIGTPTLIAGLPSSVTVGPISGPANIHVFIDVGAGLAPVGSVVAGPAAMAVIPVTIPGAAPGGPTEMRIRVCDAPAPGDCSTIGGASMSGEVEDYIVNIDEFDWGDLLDADGPTLSASGGPSHLITGLAIGPSVPDPELDGQPSVPADRDDITGVADEDGLIGTPTLIAGAPSSVTVGPISGPANIHVFIDVGAGLAPVGSVVSGPAAMAVIPVTIPGTAPTATSTEMRIRVCDAPAPGDCSTIGGASMSGEVEDYLVNIMPDDEFDWGDLLDADGPTTSGAGGPSHLITGLAMGPTALPLDQLVDPEPDGQPNAGATGDDTAGTSPDDERGLTSTALVAGSATSTVTIGGTNGAGIIHVFADKGAGLVPVGLFPTPPGLTGPHMITVDMTGAPAAGGPIDLRIRFCDTGDCFASVGSSSSGEVEDYVDVLLPEPTGGTGPTGPTGPGGPTGPPGPIPVGGTGIPISTTSLLLAGLSSNYSVLMALTVVGIGAFGFLFYSTKKKSEDSD